MASLAMASNTPAVIHMSRRSRTVVSETLLAQSRSASSHEQPVARRTKITAKQSRSGVLARWQPSGWSSTGTGTSGSIAAHIASTTSGSNARMMGQDLHSVVGLLDSTPIVSGPEQRPVDGLLFRRELPGHRPIRLSARPVSRLPGLRGRARALERAHAKARASPGPGAQFVPRRW
jgi:hypothetical protein